MKLSQIFLIFIVSLVIGCKTDTKDKTPQANEKPLAKLTEVDALTMVSEIYDTYQNS